MKNITKCQQYRGWGTIFDYMNDVPPQYIGKSFDEADHEEIDRFKNKLSNDEKWEYAYWAEYQSAKKAFRQAFVMGIILSIIVFLILLSL